jgi:hypothetical protein
MSIVKTLISALEGGVYSRLALLSAIVLVPLTAQSPVERRATLPGHVLSRLHEAVLMPRTPQMAQEPLTVTVVLSLSDPAGAEALRNEMSDPNSPQYHTKLTMIEFTARFGPTQQAYDSVLSYLQQNGLTLVTGSANRRTITVRGNRAQMEKAFGAAINDYKLGDRTFHAVAADPAVPADVAPFIASIAGLSNLGTWQPAGSPFPFWPSSLATAYNGALTPAGKTNTSGLPPGLDGSGQNIGLIEFDGYNPTDVGNWLQFANLPAKLASQVTESPINGGTTPSGCAPTAKKCGTSEVLLDIAAALGVAQGANIIVLDAPPDTDFATAVNWAINQFEYGGGVLSLSWSLCEGDVSASDVTSMDGIVADATLFGVTLFTATGDTGSTCQDGNGNKYSNNIAFPADVRHAIAVGGTVLNVNPGNAYNTESYWSSGGYGVSEFHTDNPEPAYQVSFYPGASGRSVPDVSAEAANSISICQATASASPNCPVVNGAGNVLVFGGTSLATPIWAATWALAQQAMVNKCAGGYTGCLFSPANDHYFYTVPQAFHSASSMAGSGNDFAHVGLGSPDITKLIANAVPPRVDSINPYEGPASGGTTVTMKGAGFIGVEKVTFGGVEATHVTIHSDSELTADNPVAPDSSAVVEVITPGGKATAASLYTYYPEIDGVSPNSGPAAGGTPVTITGLALGNAANFAFDYASGTIATKVKCSSSKTCTMVTPAHAPGTVDITAVTPWGYGNSTANSKDKFKYQGPSIISITPAVGPTTGGLPIVITGVDLQDTTSVNFGETVVTKLSCSATGCSLISPAHPAGSVPVTATVDGVTTLPAKSGFQFVVFPTVTGISESSGAAGDAITFTGTGFTTTAGQTTFLFSGMSAVRALSVSCTSTSTCTAVVPPQGSSTTVSVTVTVSGNTSLDSVGFAYTTRPIIPPCKGKCS